VNNLDGGFPLYILDDETIIYIFADWDHSKLWRNFVCKEVSVKYGISFVELFNMPYCQRRGRVVGKNLFCGEKITKKLFLRIKKILGMDLVLCYDEHETRCELSVARLESLKIESNGIFNEKKQATKKDIKI